MSSRYALLDANVLLRLTKNGLDPIDSRVAVALAAVVDEGSTPVCLVAQIRETYAILTREREKGGGGHDAQEAATIVREILGIVPILAERIEWAEVWLGLLTDHAVTKVQTHDAYLAAAAVASESLLVTSDRGFRRFNGLDLRLV